MRVDRLAQAFRRVAQALDGVEWWLSDGAALGAHRDGRIVGGDIDLGVWWPDLSGVAQALAGRSPAAHWSELKANVDGVKLDVHGHRLTGDVVWYPLGKAESVIYQFPARLFVEFEQIELYGLPVWVPCPVEDYLAAHYGPGWRTPRPSWRWNHDPPCITHQRPWEGATCPDSSTA